MLAMAFLYIALRILTVVYAVLSVNCWSPAHYAVLLQCIVRRAECVDYSRQHEEAINNKLPLAVGGAVVAAFLVLTSLVASNCT